MKLTRRTFLLGSGILGAVSSLPVLVSLAKTAPEGGHSIAVAEIPSHTHMQSLIPQGTRMCFHQTCPPRGWTEIESPNAMWQPGMIFAEKD